MAHQRCAIFPLFTCAELGGAFSNFRLKTWLELVELAEFSIFLQNKQNYV